MSSEFDEKGSVLSPLLIIHLMQAESVEELQENFGLGSWSTI